MSVHIPARILGISGDAKTIKGRKYGFLTGILYMAPADSAGFQVCPMAKAAGCESACLYSAGRGIMAPVQDSRINKTLAFFTMREEFVAKLVDDIRKLVKRADKAGLIPLVRLNGTSDIRWENVECTRDGVEYRNVMEAFPAVQFYDYTKIPNRKDVPANYDLTFSYSGLPSYQQYVAQAIAAGMRIAVVFRNQEDIPARFYGLECVDGDNSDIRHLDEQGVVVALYAKGNAKQDTSGFVVDSPRRVIPVFSHA